MLKKILALTLALILCLSFVACDIAELLEDPDEAIENSTGKEEKTTSQYSESTKKEPTEFETEKTTDYVGDDTAEDTTEIIDEETTEIPELSYEEKSHKCEYNNHLCSICEATVCIDENVDGCCDVCGLLYSVIENGVCQIVGYESRDNLHLYIPRYVGDYKVVEISSYALSSNRNVNYIYIPEGIVAIRADAFRWCSDLLEINIPGSVSVIENNPFYDCGSLESINVSDDNALYNSINGSLYTNDGKTLQAYAEGSAQHVEIPEGVTRIAEYAFYGYESILSIVLPKSLIEIGFYAFSECKNLTDISIPENVSIIDTDVFSDCGNLSCISVDEANENFKDIDGNLYTKNGEILVRYASGKTDTHFKVPDGVKIIRQGAFAYSNNLTSVDICEGVTDIEDYAFWHSEQLSQISLPSTLVIINDLAFAYTCIEVMTIPASVTCIDPSVFILCSRLRDVFVHPDNTQFTSDNGNLYSKDMTFMYMYAPGKSDNKFYVPDGVTQIAPSAFFGANNLVEVIISDGVYFIGGSAFQSCAALAKITIPSSIDVIDMYAFAESISLRDIYFDGTTDQWKNIRKETDWDMWIESYTVHCIDGKVSGGYGVITE